MTQVSTATATTQGPPSGAGVGQVRRLIAGAGAGLDQIRGSSLLAEGRINIVALDAVAERLGPRWEGRREQIYEHVEQTMVRSMGPAGQVVRVSDTDFLVMQPDLGVFAGQAVCVRAMTEILDFFLGPGRRGDLGVHQVSALSSDEIMAAPIDAVAAAAGERREARAAADAASANQGDDLLSEARWSPFVASSGRRIRVSCRLEPVFELKNNRRIGYRLHRRVIDTNTDHVLSAEELRGLSRGDLLKIDMAAIARGLTRMASGGEGERQLSLIIPVSFVTLSGHEGRALIATAMARARESVEKGLICEIYDIEAVPQGPLLTAVSLIKPRTLFVVGHLAADPPCVSVALKEAGLQALSIECPAHMESDAEFIGWLRAAIGAMRKATKSVMVYGCGTPRRAAMAAVLGATHASFAVRAG